MDIIFENINSIDYGKIKIIENCLNIKYAFNGTGKSSISKAITAVINNDQNLLDQLKPLKHRESDDASLQPHLSGLTGMNSVAVFDENYVNQYVFQPDELIKNSFEIFIKTPDYDAHMIEIENLIKEVKALFLNNHELDNLQEMMRAFIDGCGKSKTGLSKAGAINRGLGGGNKLLHIPNELEDYREYLQHDQNVRWIDWQIKGREYLEISDKCPYCATNILKDHKKNIEKISEEYNAKGIEHLVKMLSVFAALSEYLSDDAKAKVEEISNNMMGITPEQENFLKQISEQASIINDKLTGIKNIGFHSLKDAEQVTEELKKYQLNFEYLPYLNSEKTKGEISSINMAIDGILTKVGLLQGEVNKQKRTIMKTIESRHSEINDFLKNAGYKYTVSIEDGGDGVYKMKLKHIDYTSILEETQRYLSFGERNAFALVLFMYNALKLNPDIVILDDPVSSFDGNKKFAILNMLFMGEQCLKNKTVILLTHDFNSVIDTVYNLPRKLSIIPTASFIENNNGALVEKDIKKTDIQPYTQIAMKKFDDINKNIINKLVYLRRYLEIVPSSGKDFAWQLLSNLFKKRPQPILRLHDGTERNMLQDEINSASSVIEKFVDGFNYQNVLAIASDNKTMANIYKSTGNNYEKMQIYRIINNDIHDNPIVKKYINEVYHIENDYLFQLDPCDYELIPSYIIAECDDFINKI